MSDRAKGVFAAALSAALAAGLSALAVAPAFAKPDAEQGGLPEDSPARIEVAFVLDTTGSMSGLIEGAKRKIWSIASNMMDLEPQPEIRFALIGYRDRGDDYVTKTFDLTEDVQAIYGELLAFQANGGGDNPESVNQALAEAINDLSWSQEDSVFRAVFLVGDAPPHMDYEDDVKYPETLKVANARDILVNAVQAGGQQHTTKIWQEIAKLGGGDFAQIAQDGAMTVIDTPFDDKIETLNRKISDTVVPYGEREARRDAERKLSIAKGASGYAAAEMNAYLSKKSVSAAREVLSGGGDLVEDVENGEATLGAIAEQELPEALQAMSPEEREAYLKGRAAERAALRAELDDLLAKREAFIAEQRLAEPAPADAFDARVEGMIETQAARKGFRKK